MTNTFTPKADDLLNTVPDFQVATVKQSSGYLAYNGVGQDALDFALADAESRGGRVVVTRKFGSDVWEVANAPESIEIPDELPEDFK